MRPVSDPSLPLNQLLTSHLAMLQCFVDALPVQCFVKNIRDELVVVNQAGALMLGSTVQAARGKALSNWLDADYLARIKQQDEQVFAHGKTLRFEETLWDAEHARYLQTVMAKTPIFDAQGRPEFVIGLTLDVTEQKHLEAQTASELKLLEMLATQISLPELMAAYTRSFESIFPGVICSVLLMDQDGVRLRHGAAPSLPLAYCQAIDGLAIGPTVGSCGTAAFTRQTVIVSDIETDPLWKDYKSLALAHGLRACWSAPIMSTQGVVLGTFANYHLQPRTPQTHELQAIQRSGYLMGLAIEHHQMMQALATQETALRESEARYRNGHPRRWRCTAQA
jgi:PAS domain S-box-containing protein